MVLNFEKLAIVSSIIMFISVLTAMISASYLVANPPDTTVLRAWGIVTKTNLVSKITTTLEKVLKELKIDISDKQIEYDVKMSRLGMKANFLDLERNFKNTILITLLVSIILLLVGLVLLNPPLILFGIATMMLSIPSGYMKLSSIDRKVKSLDKKLTSEMLAILDSFEINPKPGTLEKIADDNIDILTSFRRDLERLKSDISTSNELEGFTRMSENTTNQYIKEFVLLIKSTINGADITSLKVNIQSLRQKVEVEMEEELKKKQEIALRITIAILILVFIPCVVIIIGPIKLLMAGGVG